MLILDWVLQSDIGLLPWGNRFLQESDAWSNRGSTSHGIETGSVCSPDIPGSLYEMGGIQSFELPGRSPCWPHFFGILNHQVSPGFYVVPKEKRMSKKYKFPL